MLSKSTEYAIRALIYVSAANFEGLHPGYKEIAKQIDAPEQFCAKILRILVKHQILSSGRGRGGGFKLDNLGKDVSLYQVILAIEGEKKLHGCGFGLPYCSLGQSCPFHESYAPIREQYLELTRSTDIAGLAESVRNGQGLLSIQGDLYYSGSI